MMRAKHALVVLSAMLVASAACAAWLHVARKADVARLEAAVEELSASNAERAGKIVACERRTLDLTTEIDAALVELSERGSKVALETKYEIRFAPGLAALEPEGMKALDLVAKELKRLRGKAIRVEAHTDDAPPREGGAFPTNWELSSARAVAAVRYLQERGVDPRRLSATAHAEYHPIASNRSAAGRRLNGRVELVVEPADGLAIPAYVGRAE